jgi:hypothetical protein
MLPFVWEAKFICCIPMIWLLRRQWALKPDKFRLIMWNPWNCNILKCYKFHLWTIKEVFNTWVVKCHCGDLPTILSCSWGWNNIFRSLNYYPSSFWSPQGMGDYYGWWAIIKPIIIDEQLHFFSNWWCKTMPNLPCYLPMIVILLHVYGKGLGLVWF